MKIANKISLAFLAVALVLITAAVAVIYPTVSYSLQETVTAHLKTTSQSRARNIGTLLETQKDKLTQLSQSVVFHEFLSLDNNAIGYTEAYNKAIKRLQKTQSVARYVKRIFLLNSEGKIVAFPDEEKIGLDKSTDAYFLGGKSASHIKDVYLSEEGEKLFAISAPVTHDVTKDLLGVVVALFSTDTLNEITMDRMGLGRTGEIYLVNRYGYFITPSRFIKEVFLRQKINNENMRQALIHEFNGTGNDSEAHDALRYKNYKGIEVLGTHYHIEEKGWILLVEISEKEVMAPLLRLKILFASVVVIIPLIAWLLGSVIARFIVSPIHELHKGAEIIGSGDLNYEIGTQANDEIGQLSRAFDTMTKTLKGTTVSKDYVDSILKSLTDSLIVIDPQGIVMTVNQVTCDLSGYCEEELIGKYASILFPKEEIPLKGTKLERLIKEGMLIDYETDFSTKEGLKIPVILSGAILKGIDCPKDFLEKSCPEFEKKGKHCEKFQGVVCVAKDISKRKKAEEKFKTLFMSSRDAIMTLAPPTWEFTSANPATLKLFEADLETDFLSRGPWDISPEYQPDGTRSDEKAKQMIEIAMEKGSNFFEWTYKSLKGKEFDGAVLLTKCTIEGWELLQATVRDITEEKGFKLELVEKSKELEMKNRNLIQNEMALKNMMYDMKETSDALKRAQGQLIQSEKMASVGQLAAGVAHEINNPLGYIINNLETLKKYVNKVLQTMSVYDGLKNALLRKDTEKAMKAGEQILATEEGLNIEHIRADSGDLIKETLDGARRIELIVSDLKMFSRTGGKEKKPADINEVLKRVVNVVWNEIKYTAQLKEEYGPIPEIMCDEQHLSQVFVNLLINSCYAVKGVAGVISIRTYCQDKHVCVEIDDTGEGIPEDILGKIFDPFFTTKEQGAGTGLGLSVSHEIIEKHGGTIAVNSTVGKGTRFLVSLPVILY